MRPIYQFHLSTAIVAMLLFSVDLGLNMVRPNVEETISDGDKILVCIRFPQWPIGRKYWFTHYQGSQQPAETLATIRGLPFLKQRPDFFWNVIVGLLGITVISVAVEYRIRYMTRSAILKESERTTDFWAMARLSFSLCTFTLLILWIGSSGLLYRRWAPWALDRAFDGVGERKPFIAFSSNGERLAESSDTKVGVWSVSTGRLISVLESHRPWSPLDFSPDGKTIVGDDVEGNVCIWNAETGLRSVVLKTSQYERGYSLFSPDGRYIVRVNYDGPAVLWDLKKLDLSAKIIPISCSGKISFTHDSRKVLIASNDTSAVVFNIETGVFFALRGHEARIGDISASLDGRYIVTGSDDRSMRIWDANDGSALASLPDQTARVTFARFLPNNNQVVMGCNDGSIQVFDLDTKKRIQLLTGTAEPSAIMATWPPDGTFIASVSPMGDSVQLWESQSFSHLTELESLDKDIVRVFFPDNIRMISVTWLGSVRVWRRNWTATRCGVFALPELWITGILALAVVWSCWNDRRARVPVCRD